MTKYVLDCSIYCYTKTDGCIILFNSETTSNNLSYLESLIDEFCGTEYLNAEYNPTEPCIKFSAMLSYNDELDNSYIIKEIYALLDLRNYHKSFWNIADKLKIFIQ